MTFAPTYKDNTTSFERALDIFEGKEMYGVLKYRHSFKERTFDAKGEPALEFIGAFSIEHRSAFTNDSLMDAIKSKGLKKVNVMEPDACLFDATNNVEHTRELVGVTLHLCSTARSVQVDLRTLPNDLVE